MKRFVFSLFAAVSLFLAFGVGHAGAAATFVNSYRFYDGPPFPSRLLAWWDNRTADFTTTSGSIDTWTDRVHGVVLTGTTSTRPKLVTADGSNYVQFDSQFFTLPGGFSWNHQNSSLYVVMRRSARDTDITSIWRMNTTPPVYDGFYLGGQRLSYLSQTVNANSATYLADNLSTVFRISGSGGVLIGAGGDHIDGYTANNTGTLSAGGFMAKWDNTDPFPGTGMEVVGIFLYGDAIDTVGTEHNQVLDFATRHHRATSRASTIMFAINGDSLTQGTDASNERMYNWTAQLMRHAPNYEPKYANVAVAGTQVGDGNTLANEVLTQLGLNLNLTKHRVIILKGSNDLEVGTSAATTIVGLTNAITRIHGEDPNGVDVTICTIFARNFITPTAEAQRLLLNSSIRSGATGADRVVDLAAASELSTYSNTTYFNADGIHLTDEGYRIVYVNVYSVVNAAGLFTP